MNAVTSVMAAPHNGIQGTVASNIPDLTGLSHEAEIILLCSRSVLDESQKARVRSRLLEPFDPDYFFELAFRHGVLPLVCNNLLLHFSFDLDEQTKLRAGEFCRQHALRNMSMTGILLEIVSALDAVGIPSVPFKGPTLAQRVYKSIALRQFLDLDILVLPRHFERAVKVLLESGYEALPNSDLTTREILRINRRKDVSLVHPTSNVRIELHWKLSGSYFSMPLQLSHLWSRMDKTQLGGMPISTLPFDDLFVYLCVHAARHGFERLEWVCDLNELIQSEEGVDWSRVRHHARIHGCERALELSLFLVFDLFGTRPDYPDFDRIERDELLLKTVRKLRGRMFNETQGANGIGDWYGYHLLLKEKRRDRVKLHLFYLAWYLKLIFRPNSADETAFHLPTPFYPLYFVLRPARLLFNYLANQNLRR